MKFVNCIVKKNIPIKALIDTGANISKKYISELEIIYHRESNSILGNINLHIGFNDD
jgi:hypothetical protein